MVSVMLFMETALFSEIDYSDVLAAQLSDFVVFESDVFSVFWGGIEDPCGLPA